MPRRYKIVGLQILGGLDGDGFLLLGRQGDAQSLGDFARDFVLHFEDVLHFAIVAFGPQRKIGASVDELRVDAQAITGAAQAAGQDVSGFQLLADLRRRDLFIAIGEDRGTRENVQAL